MAPPVSPREWGEGPEDDAALEAGGWAAGLDVWEPVSKAYAQFVGDMTLANSQLWSLHEAVRAEVWREAIAALRSDELADRIAEATAEHHIATGRPDADGNDPCVCGQWWDSEHCEGWDEHMAAVSLAAAISWLESRLSAATPGEPRMLRDDTND